MNDLLGSQLGHYRLTRLLGKGGFANVYLGEHIHLNTWAAIKVLQTRLEGGDIEQFRNEARLIAHLKHPHIVPILDFGVQGDIPYLVMEYAVNGTLRNYYAHRLPMQPLIALPSIHQVASALQFAHEQHLVHRDVKPENMLLNANKDVLLSDFGLALITQSTYAMAQSSANATDAAGTVYYMAPEQIQGHAVPASDQYALAVVVYEWLTGTRPFVGTTYVEIAMQHVSKSPPPLRSKVATIPQVVEDVVLRALAKEPQQRFPNVKAFADALEQACRAAPLVQPLAKPLSETALKPATNVPFMPPIEATLESPSGRIPLGTKEVAIGRASENHVVLNDAQVSARHAVIRPDSIGYSVVDVGSVNGTFVNGQRIEQNRPRLLSSGDAIALGNSRLTFEARSSGTIPRLGESQLPTERASVPVMTPVQQQPVMFPPVQPISAIPPQPPAPLYLPQAAENPPYSGYNVAVNSLPFQATGAIAGANQWQPAGPNDPYTPLPSQGPVRPTGQPKWLWVGLSVLALLLLVGGGIGYYAYSNALSTPIKTLDAFCSAIQSGNSTQAYNQFAASYQNEVSPNDFQSIYGKANGCTHDAPVLTGNTAQANWTLTIGGQRSTIHGDLSQDKTNTWKIADDTQLFGMMKMLDTYCTALKSGDYDTAHGQFSSTLQKNLPIDLFTGIFPKATSCNHTNVVLEAKGATVTLATVSANGQNQSTMVTLVQDASNVWKIDDFGSLPQKTMSAFCNALQQKDYPTAYNQFSRAFQGNETESQFADSFKVVTSCSSGAITVVNNHVTTVTTLGVSSGQSWPYTTYLVQDSSGTWQIDNLFNGPYETMFNFCNGLKSHNYQTAYAQLSPGYQSSISETDFANTFSVVADCTFTFPTQNGTTAVSQVTFTGVNGKTLVYNANLVQEADQSWKIESFTNPA